MAGLSWFELDVDMPDDPKCSGLASRLGNPLAFAYVVRLYAYCYRHATDHFTGPGAVATIEETACRWKGKTGALFSALDAEGFIDHTDDGYSIHGVAERLGPHLQKLERDRSRARERREVVAKSYGRRADVAPTSPGCRGGQVEEQEQEQIHQPTPLPPDGSEARLTALRLALAARLVKPPEWFRLSSAENIPDTRARLDAELARLGVDRAADVVAARAREEGRVRQWLRYYLGPLGEAQRSPLPAAQSASPLPAPDPAFLAAHPEAAERWAEIRSQVTATAADHELRQQLAGMLELLRAEFTEAA